MPYAKRFGVSKGLGLNAKPTLTGIEAAGQTFLKGALLVNSSGSVAGAGTNPTGILGVAEEDATGTTGNAVRFIPALPHVLFEARLLASGSAHTLVQANLYAEYGVTVDADGYWYVDVDKTTTNGRFKILEFVDPVGTSSARVRGVFTYDATLYAAS